ncbi:MAG: hypothetical protein JRG92_01350 [Deltaproteobacteria bacterium]|nr:hypothetical protein [Deltaproteobacteria bacterium]
MQVDSPSMERIRGGQSVRTKSRWTRARVADALAGDTAATSELVTDVEARLALNASAIYTWRHRIRSQLAQVQAQLDGVHESGWPQHTLAPPGRHDPAGGRLTSVSIPRI